MLSNSTDQNYIQSVRRSSVKKIYGGARGVRVIIVGNGHGDTSSNPGRGWLHFT